MRTFALLAFLAAYASGTELRGDKTTADAVKEADAASDAIDAALDEAAKDADAATDAAEDKTDGEAGETKISDEDLAASIDGALAQADENGKEQKKNP